MCAKHYRYWIDHTPKEQRSIAPRFSRDFWDSVLKSHEHGCWTWTGPKIKRTGHGTWGKVLAHRHSWALANGPIPDGMWVLHHCDNPPCVNPRHLYLGTVIENVRDAIARGRFYVPPRKTHCAQGHALEGDNLRIVNTKQGERRVCRTCDNTRSRELQRKRRGSDRLSQSKD